MKQINDKENATFSFIEFNKTEKCSSREITTTYQTFNDSR